MLEIGRGTEGATFVDYAPVHLITSATLAHVGAEMIRYRPNLVVDLPGAAAFAENEWIGREVSVGPARLRVMLPTPRSRSRRWPTERCPAASTRSGRC